MMLLQNRRQQLSDAIRHSVLIIVTILLLHSAEAYGQCSTVIVSPGTTISNCTGAPVTFSATGGSNYRWYKGTPDATPEGTGGSFTVSEAGNYFLLAYNGCQDQAFYLVAGISTTPAQPAVGNGSVLYNNGLVVKPGVALPVGDTYRWYASNQTTLLWTGLEFYTGPLTLSSNTFYVSRWNGSCESAKDPFTVSVTAMPTVNSGADVKVTLPLTSTTLTGTATGSTLTYQWIKLTGPAVTMSNTTTTTVTLTNITAGSYVFRLTVTDSYGQRTSDDVVFEAAPASPTNNYNYTREEKILIPGITAQIQTTSLTVEQKNSLTTYMDDVGRTMEEVTWQSSPDKLDGIKPVVYDELGRSAKTYLSTVSTSGNAQYRTALNTSGEYSGTEIQSLYTDKPYSVMVMDNSPLGRPVEQGATGQDWQPGSSSGTVKMVYGSNAANEVRLWTINTSSVPTGVPNSTATWAAGKLRMMTSTGYISDTPTPKQTVSQIFVDIQGLKVLERTRVDASTWAETYYVYDGKNNLRFVIPPAFVKILKDAANYNATQVQTDRWCFQNVYDDLNRVIASKAPATDWTYKVYDKRGRVILQQDGLQRLSNSWSFYKYDTYDRVVIAGVYKPTIVYSGNDLQQQVDALDFGRGYLNTTGMSYALNKILTSVDLVLTSPDPNYLDYQATNSISFKPGFTVAATTTSTITASIGNGQSQWDNAFPSRDVENLSVSYFDDYSGNNSLFQDPAYQFSAENFTTTVGDPFVKFDRVKTKITGASVKILGTDQWLHVVTYYDQKQRPIQVISNNHMGVVKRESMLYDYTGKVLETRSSSSGNYLVEWKEPMNVVVENNGTTLRKSAGTANWGDAGAVSVNELAPGERGWVETEALEVNKARMFGFSENNTNAHYNTIDYAIYLAATGQLYIYENGSSRITAQTYTIGDKLRVERIGTTIYYRKNGVLIYQSTVASTTRLMVETAFYTLDGKLQNTYASFGNIDRCPFVVKRFTYDHAGRRLKIYEKYNSQPEVVVSSFEYDELGQLKDKKIHSSDNGSTYLQSTDYEYNIRGWLTKANSAAGSDAGETDYFGYELAYQTDAFSASAAPRKDGIISAVKWRNDLTTKQRIYVYDYDGLGRLTSANYKAGTAAPWSSQSDFYNENSITYDQNGNIRTLKRNQKKADLNQMQAIDDLTYNYGTAEGNQLMKVTDGSASPGKALGFNDGNTTGDDYVYDVIGNLIQDKNKGMTITYNVINLPDMITFSDNTYTKYTYDASGKKLSQAYYDASNQLLGKTDYAGGQVFVNDMPVVAFHSEGRLLPSACANLFANRDANSTEDFSANQNVTLTATAQGVETYVKVVSNQATGTPGVMLGNYSVKPGERYAFKVLGYRETTHNAYLYVNSASGNIMWLSSLLPQGLANETWTTGEFIVPDGVTQVTLGVLMSNPASGATFHINKVSFYKKDWEYQYFLTDQLGNTHVVLGTDAAKLNYTATFETENQVAESGLFFNINTTKIAVHTSNTTPGGNEVITMDNTYRVGPSRSLKVYPGDQIDALVSVYYPTASGLTDAPVNTMITALTGVMTGNNITGFDGGIASAYNNSAGGMTGFALSPSNGSTRPSAFLNYILFDENYAALEAKSVPVGPNANVTHLISFSSAFGAVTVKEKGYMFVYLSYDNENTHPVYFDELKIRHSESPMVQVNDYYAFGLTSNSWLREGEFENRYLYQGKELDPKTGWENFHARQYDPTVGRWFANDPKGLLTPFSSNYAAMMNGPTMYVDPDGELAFLAIVLIGAAVFGTTNVAIQAANGELDSFGDGLKAFASGAIVGAVVTAGVVAGLGVPFTAAIIKGAAILYGSALAVGTIAGVARGVSTGDWGILENTWKIFAGNFYLDSDRAFYKQILQGISRFTWELPNTVVGHSFTQLRNLFGNVDRVDYFGGATFASDLTDSFTDGVSIGNYINVWNPNHDFDPINDRLLRHEYGHTFDSYNYGWSYLVSIGIPSASKADWTERRANYYAYFYFKKYGVKHAR